MTRNRHDGIEYIPDVDFSRILTNPILDIAARVWDDDRYAAFRICYRSMRIIDDLVDNARIAETTLTERRREEISKQIEKAVSRLRSGDTTDPSLVGLMAVRERFAIPLWPWERLAGAMIYDLYHDSFKNFAAFLRYCEGSAIAPAAIFVHLCGVTLRKDVPSRPDFNIRVIARPLALFSYLVHIIRDFQKDQQAGLNYFSDELLNKHGISKTGLRQIAADYEITAPFRSLMADYYRIADYYRNRARQALDRNSERFTAQYRISLELIYQLYKQIFERIDPENGSFSAEELNPTPEQVQARIELTLNSASW